MSCWSVGTVERLYDKMVRDCLMSKMRERFLFSIFTLISFLCLYQRGLSENISPSSSTESLETEKESLHLEKEQLQKISLKTLRNMLEERGVECAGCAEKANFVDRVYETQDLPKVETPLKKPPQKKPQAERTPQDRENIEEVLEKLKKSGFGGAKVFSADDLKDLSPEEMNKKFGGDSNPPKRPPRSKGKTPPKTEL